MKLKQIKSLPLSKKTALKVLENHSALIVTILIIIIATIVKGTDFLSVQNFINILRNNSVIGIIAIGMTFVIISGGIDLSVGSILVATGAVIIIVMNATESILLSLFCGLIFGILAGLINGLIITKGHVPAFIVTLGAMNIYRSVAQHFMNGGGSTSTSEIYKNISNWLLFGTIPLPILYFIAICIIMHLISKHTRYGRHVYAIGSNEKAAKLSAVNVDRVKIMTYILMAVCVVLATVVETSRMNSINASSSGHFYELDAIAAVVVGGTSMAGGRGSIAGTFFGVLILGIVNNMMVLIGVPPFLVGAVKGTIVILAVLLQKKEQEV